VVLSLGGCVWFKDGFKVFAEREEVIAVAVELQVYHPASLR
jgi:hypothetical protein